MFHHDDIKMSKTCRVQIIHCCNIHFYDTDCALVKNKKL